MKKFIATLLLAFPLIAASDTAGSTKLLRFLADMTITRTGWCEVAGATPNGIVEYRKVGVKKAYEIFTPSGHFLMVEVRRKTYGAERYYFSGEFVSNGPGKIRFDATEHEDVAAWGERMGNRELLIMAYFPDMETPPPGCKWSRKK